MSFPTYAVPTGQSANAQAGAAFQSAATGAGLQVQTLPALAALQIAVANLFGQAGATETPGDQTVNGDLSVTGVVSVAADSLRVATSTPAAADATGVAGTISWDADYVYVCVATNTWKRVAISTWP